MSPINPQTIALLKRRLEEAERNIQLIRQLLQEEGDEVLAPAGAATSLKPPIVDTEPGEARVIHGTFDGEHMKGEDGQLYPVPANYASKSKLVEGDRLKLTIESDGAFIYKQVGPIERRRVRGIFGTDDQGHCVVRADDKEYRVLLASVTFYHIELGDDVTILLPTEGDAHWGAVEHVLKTTAGAESDTAGA